MSVSDFPSPPAEPKPTGRRGLGSCSLVPAGKESPESPNFRNKCHVLDRYQPISTSLQSDCIPEEILQVLTYTAKATERSNLAPVKKSKTPIDGKGGLRSTDQIWHHPLRRSKFKHLTEQPVCLTGAGRDISFLCDVFLMEKKSKANASLRPATVNDAMSPRYTEGNIEDSLVPKEFYVVKNKGVLGLEYYEDKYTTLLEDHEKRLQLFPSIKPSGRSEVLQLMKVMDSMLKHAGVDEEDLKMEGPTQMHNLLELLKTEQNIYNVVFHELIRQVSVDCVERGELLARLRQRYVMLLDKIPHQVQSLYSDLLAQRALDRRLTDELINFKNSIGELTHDLYQVREHDLRVSKDAMHAQEELAKALREAKKNANLLEEYRELYELQRHRLENHLLHLTEERDLWSSATYRLARKVIEENQLQLARRLYMSEKSWIRSIRHFIVLLASKDTSDLTEIQQATERWRGLMACFGQEVQRNEESTREKLRLIHKDLEKWQQYFQEKVFVNWKFQAVPDVVIKTILEDLKSWENMLTQELQQFEGALLLSSQDTLKTAAGIHNQWVALGNKLLRRHESLDGNLPPEQKAMEDVSSSIRQLCEQYRRRVEGENGVPAVLTSLFYSLESWSLRLHALKNRPHGVTQSDWLNFCNLIPEWIAQTEKALELIGSPESEAEPSLDPVEKVLPEDVFRELQHWVLATTAGTERDDAHLTQEGTNLHTAMVQYMVNVLMFLSPDYVSDPNESVSASEFGEEAFHSVTEQKMQEEAHSLSQKVNLFSSYMIRCCQEMAENISMENRALSDEDPDYELREIKTVRNSCNEWIETCQLLLLDVTGDAIPFILPQTLSSIKDSESRRAQPATMEYPQEVVELEQDDDVHVEFLNGEKMSVTLEGQLARREQPHDILDLEHSSDISIMSLEEEEIPVILKGDGTQPDKIEHSHDTAEFEHDHSIDKKSGKEKEVPTTVEGYRTPTRREHLQEKMELEQDVMRIIGHDGNIHKKSLKGEEIPVSPEGILRASRPMTPRSMQAFEALASLEQLQKRLLFTEQRAQKAEERSESLDEQLKAALQKIQELERERQSDESGTQVDETNLEPPSPSQPTPEKSSSPPQPKKKPKSGKAKQK
ncbi:axonemal dynein light chain domain-containing protein 1 [Ascaphus truei]|uniref:axonemal dynein light chain domain-containing protein 1 n=1 Tax=Ascaphus truei TaxID=8439 RepID=UPI003F5A616B